MKTHTYDDFPYLCLIRPDIQPRHLATLATLFNLQPPSVEAARILELGCGNGINLIAIAQSLPQAHCLGIDYSAQQIAHGQKIINEVGLANITLQQLDILDFDKSYDQFDYIIIHGVYSWVAGVIQNKLLSICQHHLAPSGIAYLSYNTYPGGYLDQIMRDMMLYYHAHQFTDSMIHPLEIKQLLAWVVEINQSNRDAYSLLLQEQLERLQKSDADNYLRHDLLESEHQPVYFYQFIEQVREHGLEYVTDVKFRDSLSDKITWQHMKPTLKGDFVTHEQYLDFFYKRKLRMSLLCHQGCAVNRELDPNLMERFYIAATPALSATLNSHQRGYVPKTIDKPNPFHNPLTQSALNYLSEIYPSNILFKTLFAQMSSPLSNLSTNQLDELRHTFATHLLSLFSDELIYLEVHHRQPVMTKPSDYPTVIPLARWQASQGQTTIVNSLGQLGQLDEFTRQLLPYLNGKNDRHALLDIIKTLVKQHNLTVIINEKEVSCNQLAEPELQEILNLYLDETVQIIARNALLVS